MLDDTNLGADDDQDDDDLEQSDPKEKPFLPQNLDRTVIAIPLLKDLNSEDKGKKAREAHDVIIDLNLEYDEGREAAREWVVNTINELLAQAPEGEPDDQFIKEERGIVSPQYVFARLRARAIRGLVTLDVKAHDPNGTDFRKRAIYHIWPDFQIRALTNKSISTVKADAAGASFAAFGEGIVWAVLDSGIQFEHPHFKDHKNLTLELPLEHFDFTGKSSPCKVDPKEGPCKIDPQDGSCKVHPQDPFGHGTHVAGIIAGEIKKKADGTPEKEGAVVRSRDEKGKITYRPIDLKSISGMAPKCKLVSMRVLDESGKGDTSSLISAISKIQEINGFGRRLLIHGVNISVGNSFDPEWFACGQSPLCTEVNHLVNSGVVVVVAAGNSGYGIEQTKFTGVISAGMGMTINDPGNADLAITVGSTHRDMPHIYGVSYFSSKGPTGDGRSKPDIVAPGEKIISCAAGASKQKALAQAGQNAGDVCDYVEDSGTSMAAPHVSGVIAAFLSIRREFIGRPDKVKEIFLSTATDLKRERYFQGHGLVDLMRAIQSV